jgi:cell division protein FtsW
MMGVVLVAQPDLGNAILVGLLLASLLFLGGARLTHLAVPVLAALPLAYHLIFSSPYRRARVLAFLDPFADPRHTGFQLIQSFVAFGSGGVLGKGLGNSGQKLFYLPEAHTDFVFSILGEECGLWGTTLLLALFLALGLRGARIAQEAPDLYTFSLAWGLTGLLVLPAVLNMAVTTGLIPTKGLPMPFVSYGGSSLVISLVAAGLLYNLSRVNALSRYT